MLNVFTFEEYLFSKLNTNATSGRIKRRVSNPFERHVLKVH